MLPHWIIFVAISLRLGAGAGYIASIVKGETRPNPITWFFWGITPLIAGIGQLQQGVGISTLMTFALGVGPLLIFGISLAKGRAAIAFNIFNVTCGLLALLGIILWQLTHNPQLAILFSIAADICGGLPTVRKAFLRPGSEPALPYLISMTSMTLTVFTIQHWTFANCAFPLYIFMINAVIFSLVVSRVGRRLKARMMTAELDAA
jgi:hypothetical protein